MNTGFQGSSLPDLSEKIKEKTRELGFDICGIARSRPLMEYRPILEEWIGAGMHDRMNFLARDIPKRLDPGYP